MSNKKFSKDPKVKLLSLEDFFACTDYLYGIKKCVWKEGERPDGGNYFKITPRFLIAIDYSCIFTNFGMDISEKLESITVAFRDGKTEFELLESKMQKLLKRKTVYKQSKKIDGKIKDVEFAVKQLKKEKYSEQKDIKQKCFEEYLVDAGYKTSFDELKGKYVVFDVETNGTRKTNDDLLSISIYDPATGRCYNRYLPLELQPLVLTTWINGIKDKDLINESHINQEELNKVIDFFDLKNKVLLSFSGGKGTFDSDFIINYCKRHGLVGFEDLHFENIKSMFPDAGFGSEGQMSKDNLCRLLKIDGVQEVHSGINDCILEWKLFERIKTEPLFFIKQRLFKYHEGYIVPVSYLIAHPELVAFANITVPYIEGKAKLLYQISLPKKVLRKIKKFPTNITGISLENGINSALNVERQDNVDFLTENKRHLEYIGSLDSRIQEIPVQIQDDGTIKSLLPENDSYIEDVNKVTKEVTESLSPVFDFIRNNIFTGDKIMSQELSISEDGKVLALCDLSDKENVLEIKTFGVSEQDGSITEGLARQLYYQSKGRKTFALSIDIESHFDKNFDSITDAVNVRIYQIDLKTSEPKPYEIIRTLWNDEIEILKIIKNNPSITNTDIAKEVGRNPCSIGRTIKKLMGLGYLKKEDPNKKFSNWILLREIDDTKTRFMVINGKATIVLSK